MAYYFERYGCRPESLPRHLYGMLSPEGQHLLRQQLKELADSLLVVIEDGFDLTFERRLLEFVSRQVYFGVMLGCCRSFGCSLTYLSALDMGLVRDEPS